jgi:hypothetical protein
MGFLLFVRDRFAATPGETIYTLTQHSVAVKLAVPKKNFLLLLW